MIVRKFINKHFKYITTVPSTVLLVLLTGFPLVYVIYISFFVKNVMQGEEYFTGLGNYIGIFKDPTFWHYLKLSLQYTFFSVAAGFLISLLVAYILDQTKRARGLLLSVILIPWLLPVVTTAIMWKWLFHDIYGLINIVLLKLNLVSAPVNWLGSPDTAMFCLVLTDVWFRNPFDILLLYSGMKRIPLELIDAAKIDGANSWKCFRYITLPEIKTDILIILVIRTMFVLREVGLPFALTRGGPGDSTEVLAVWVYKLTNLSLRQGMGATVSVIMLLLTCVIVLAYLRLLKNKE